MIVIIFESKIIKYGDNVNTDAIIAGKYTKTLDMSQLAAHAMEDLDPLFPEKLKTAKIIVAGKNFGCGSSREGAPLALKYAGIQCVIAKSFARIFYRNAINIGFYLIDADTTRIEEGNIVRFQTGDRHLLNVTSGERIDTGAMPQIMTDILNEGGLVNYLCKYGSYVVS